MIAHVVRKKVPLIISAATAFLGAGLSWKFQTVPRWFSNSLTYGGGIALVAGLTWLFSEWLTARLPARPWFPENPLHCLAWLKLRPNLSFVGMVPKEDREISGIVIDCRLTFTLYQAFDQVTGVNFDYEPAILEVTQSTNGLRRRFHFRPVETGGLLSLMQSARMSGVQVEFAWTGVPAWPDNAPDLSAAFEWKLSGVRATIHGPRQISGRLPPVRDYRPSAAEMLRIGTQTA